MKLYHKMCKQLTTLWCLTRDTTLRWEHVVCLEFVVDTVGSDLELFHVESELLLNVAQTGHQHWDGGEAGKHDYE